VTGIIFRNGKVQKETGASLIETVIALALVGVISTAFLGALTTSTNSRLIADEHVSAGILAQSIMENLRKQTYSSSYASVPIPEEYAGYSSSVDIDNMRNGNIQKITITITHHNKVKEVLESYKVNR
jgi:Tfp pilus assembly protein PilV